jgi:hypothetical protein
LSRLLAIAVALLALAAIALLAIRPARVVGVSGASLAHSIEDELDAHFEECSEVPGGRQTKTAWRCSTGRPGSGSEGTSYAVEADGWGCWEAQRLGGGDRGPSACVSALDYADFLE